jgi:hypothetical protein
MSYRYRYINTHTQFGRTSCTLILNDLETGMPDVRIDKEFNVSLSQLDAEMLYQAAAVEIQVAQIAYNAWAAQQAQADADAQAQAQVDADQLAAIIAAEGN